jgi:hypothetical protein
METLTTERQDQDLSQARQTSALAGSLALHKRTYSSPQNETIYPKPFEGVIVSEIPKALVHEEGNGRQRSICPASFDKIENIGEPKISLKDGSKIFYYDIFGQKHDEFEENPTEDAEGNPIVDPVPETRLILVKTEDGVRYIIAEPHYNPMASHSDDRNRFTQFMDLGISQEPGGKEFLETIGYIFVNDQVYAPSPETLKAFCAKHGIEVEIHKDKSKLEHPEYLKAYRAGKYPIGALDKFYSHDIQDDHITALIIGGAELQKTIATSVENLLRLQKFTPKDLSSLLDAFTATFRSVILPYGTEGEAYGKEGGRTTLKFYGDKLNIQPEVMDELILIAQQRAIGFGMQPKELS